MPAELEDMKVESVKLDDLHVDPANVRRHGPRNQSTIRASLARFGAARSIVVDGKGIVRAGNGTLEAARDAGITEALVVDPRPDQLVVVRRKDWSPTEATAYSIGDNQSTLQGEWDDPGLAEHLRALQSEDFDLAAIGFDAGEVDQLLERLAAEAVPPEDFAAYDEAIETAYCCPQCGYRWSGKPQ